MLQWKTPESERRWFGETIINHRLIKGHRQLYLASPRRTFAKKKSESLIKYLKQPNTTGVSDLQRLMEQVLYHRFPLLCTWSQPQIQSIVPTHGHAPTVSTVVCVVYIPPAFPSAFITIPFHCHVSSFPPGNRLLGFYHSLVPYSIFLLLCSLILSID